jgi:hypothetical protein
MLTSGCALRALFGNVIIVEDLEEEVNEIITTIFSDSTAAVCLETVYSSYECTYIIDGEIITSTLSLISEFGLTGVLIDPVILQVPDDVSEITATYDAGSGPQPLSMWNTQSFSATPDNLVTAEAGNKFLILELPPAVTHGLPIGDPNSAPQLSYSLSFKRTQPINEPVDPMRIKILLAGKVVINQHPYYVPLLPCTTDFTSLPSIEIPKAAAPVNLNPGIAALLAGGGNPCDHQGYYFNNVPPPPKMVYLPAIEFAH